MGFINDMLGWDQARKQGRIRQEMIRQTKHARSDSENLAYLAQAAYEQTLLLDRIARTMEAMNDTLTGPLTVVDFTGQAAPTPEG